MTAAPSLRQSLGHRPSFGLYAPLAVLCLLALVGNVYLLLAAPPAPAPIEFSQIPAGWQPPLWLAVASGLTLLILLAAPWQPWLGLAAYLVASHALPRYGPESYRLAQQWLPLQVAFLAAWAWAISPAASPASLRASLARMSPLLAIFALFAFWCGVTSLVANVSGPLGPAPLLRSPLLLLAPVLLAPVVCLPGAAPAVWARWGLVLGLALAVRGLAFPLHTHLDGDLAALLAIALPLLLLAAAEGPPLLRLFAAALLAVDALLLLRTENRGGGLAALALLLPLSLAVRPRWLWLVLVPLLAVGGIAFRQTPYYQRFADIVQRGQAYDTVASRLELWRAGWQMAGDHPGIGVGLGRFAAAARQYHASDDIAGIVAHNSPLSLAAETGVAGLALWLLLFAWSLVALLARARTNPKLRVPAACLAAAVLAYLIASQFLSRHDLALAYLLALAPAGWLTQHIAPPTTVAAPPPAQPLPGMPAS